MLFNYYGHLQHMNLQVTKVYILSCPDSFNPIFPVTDNLLCILHLELLFFHLKNPTRAVLCLNFGVSVVR